MDRSVIVSPASTSEVVILFGDGGGGLRSIRRLPILDRPRDLSVADFDRDGLIDFVVVGEVDSVQLFISRGDGLFLTRLTAIPGPQRAVVSPDVDSDGLPDLVLLGEVAEVTVLRNTGSGQFEMVASYAVEPESRSLGAADFDLDGHPDIAVAAPGSNPLVIGDGTLSLLLGRGDGTFTPAAVLRTKSPGAVIPGDFNGDGRVDIATRTDGALTLLLNQAPYPWRNPLQGQPPGVNDFLGAAAVVTFPGGAPQIVETPHLILAGDVSRATLVLSLAAQVLAGGDGRVGTVDDIDLRDSLQVRASGTDLALRYLSPDTVAVDLPPDLTDLDLLLSVFGVELGTSRIRRDVDGLHIAR